MSRRRVSPTCLGRPRFGIRVMKTENKRSRRNHPPKTGLLEWLERDEARSRKSRAVRLEFLIKEYGGGSYRVFYSEIAALAFEEARQAYLHGLFVACTTVCQVCVEQLISRFFRAAGRNDLDRAPYQQILVEARSKKVLSESEFVTFDKLREHRNPYVHSRSPLSKSTLAIRAVDSNALVEHILDRDARTAIRALLRLCQRAPFAV